MSLDQTHVPEQGVEREGEYVMVQIANVCPETDAAVGDVSEARIGDEADLAAGRAFVGDGNAGVLLKRHGEKGVERFVRRNGERNRLVKKILAEAETEEIADRGFDAGRRFTVPIHAEDKFFEMKVFGRGDGDPDVRDDARSANVEQIERSAGSNGASVGVAAATVITGDAFLQIVMRLREGEKRLRVTGTRLRVERRGKKKRAGEKEEFAHEGLTEIERARDGEIRFALQVGAAPVIAPGREHPELGREAGPDPDGGQVAVHVRRLLSWRP